MSELYLPNKVAFVDVETHGLEARYNPEVSVYFVGIRADKTNQIYTDVQEAISRIYQLEALGYCIVAHNAKFDYNVLRVRGYQHRISPAKFSWVCTAVLAYFMNKTGNISLGSFGDKTDVVQACLDKGLDVPNITKKFWEQDWSSNQPVLDVIEHYLEGDLTATAKLYGTMFNKYKKHPAQTKALLWEFAMIEPLAAMERSGAYIDPKLLKEHRYQTSSLIAGYMSQMRFMCPKVGFNKKTKEYFVEEKIYPPKKKKDGTVSYGYKNKLNIKHYMQEGRVISSEPSMIYDHCKLVPFNPNPGTNHTYFLLAEHSKYANEELLKLAGTTKTGKYQINNVFLSDIGDELPFPLADANLEIKNLQTIASISKFLRQGRIYGNYNNCLTATGRLSSSNPNLQNIPRPTGTYSAGAIFRQLFSAPPGKKILVADLDSIELAVLAWYLKNVENSNVMFDAINAGISPHTANAEAWDIPRPIAKMVIFLIVYGGTYISLVRRRVFDTEKEAKAVIDKVNKKEPAIETLRQKVISKVRDTGFLSNTFGNYWTYPNLNSKQGAARGRAERQVFNCLIQGTARDVLHRLVVEMFPVIEKYGAKLVNIVHDECVVEVDADKSDQLIAELNKVWNVRTDILPGIRINGDWNKGDNWYQAK